MEFVSRVMRARWKRAAAFVLSALTLCTTSMTVAANETGTSASATSSLREIVRPHRAVYDVTLDKASDRSGIRGIDGRIVYEIKGSRCEGYAVRFRILVRVQSSRRSFTSDQRNTSFESGDGSSFNFSNQTFLNDQLETSIQGVAKREPGGLAIEFSKPADTRVDLDDALFLTQHVEKLIQAARAEETIVTARIYDAGNDGQELVDTTAIIGKIRSDIVVDDEPEEIADRLKGRSGWPMSVSYFAIKENAARGERLPDYQASFIMQEDGVTRRLKMTYPDYSLRGKLTNLEYFETPTCE